MLVKIGTGTQTLTAANTFTGSTTISGGVLQLGSGSTTGSLAAAGTIVDNATFAVNRSNTATQGTDFSTAAITGTGGFAQLGTGTTVMTAANTYAGPTLISAGTLQLGSGGTTGSIATSSVITDNGTFAIDRSDTVTQGTDFSGAGITGTGGFAQLGTGTTVLLAANTYSGTTLISAGTLQLGNGTSGNDGSVSGAIVDNSSLVYDLFSPASYSGAITGTGNVVQEGARLTLTNATSTFSGGLTIDTSVNVSTVAASGPEALGEGTISLAGTNSSTGLLNYTGGNGNLGNAITVTGSQGTINNSGNGVLTLSGAITKNGTTLNLTGTGGLGSGSFNVTGQITGANANSDLNVIGTTVELSNTNSYNGPTSVYGTTASSAGADVLQTEIAGALPSASVVTLGSAAEGSNGFENVFDLNGFSQTIAGLSSVNDANDLNYVVNGNADYGATPVTVAPSTLTIAPGAGSTNSFGGVLGGGGSSANFGVTMAGSGTQVFTNTNTYTGPTTVSSGTLYVNGGASINTLSTPTPTGSGSGTGSGMVTVNGGVLAGSGGITGTSVAVSGGGTLRSGGLQSTTSGAVDGTHMTISSTPVTIGSSTGTATLAFSLGSGTTGINGGTASSDFSNPNSNTTYLSLTGSTTMNFVGTTSIALIDLTNTLGNNGSVSLHLNSPYLLVQAGSNVDYLNLVINSGTAANPIYSLSQNDATVNGFVVGVYTGTPGGAINSSDTTPISITQYGSDGVTALTPGANGTSQAPVLYLNSGNLSLNLEVVPEPGTWALMLGGLALLIVIQRRRNKLS